MEKLLRKMVVEALRPLHAVSVENGVGAPGTPDVNCAAGWIELKELDAWPKRENTPVSIPHYTQEQKIWAMKRHAAGGKCWFLLKVGCEFLLFVGATAARIVGYKTRAELIQLAELVFLDGFEKKEFLAFFIDAC